MKGFLRKVAAIMVMMMAARVASIVTGDDPAWYLLTMFAMATQRNAGWWSGRGRVWQSLHNAGEKLEAAGRGAEETI